MPLMGWTGCWRWTGCVQVWILLAVTVWGVVVSTETECNQTINIADLDLDEPEGSTFTLPTIGRSARGKPFYCWFRFEGTHAQYVSVDVTDLRVGEFNVDSGSCEGGYLRISDTDTCSTDEAWFPPTEICGLFDEGRVRVRRYTRSPSAFVEYRVDKAKKSKSYQFEVEFLDIATDYDTLPYGHLQRKKGRVENTKCDWLIDVDECYGGCEVQTPGYPGIYPPNTRCRYLLVSFSDARIQLQMGGLGFKGKFDMKRTDNCSASDDYVEVFDGMSSQSESFGRFCGHDGYHLVSTGEGILLLFQSGVGGPPWDYSGFNLIVTDRWRNEHEGGTKVPGMVCDWTFESRGLEDGEGATHTPDHMLGNSTMCVFEFSGLPNELLEIEVVVRKLDPDCNEYLEIYDANEPALKICAEDIDGKKSFFYNSTTPTPSVHYVKLEPQLSNLKPSWIYFEFVKVPDAEMRGAQPPVVVAGESKLPGSGTASTPCASTMMVLMTSSLLALTSG